MQSIEQTYTLSFIQRLNTLRNGLSFKSEQAWMFSEHYMANYISEHAATHTGTSDEDGVGADNKVPDDQRVEVPALLATARLHWLLQKARRSLSGLLSEHDVNILLDCYQGVVFFPDQFDSMASDLANHFGIDIDDYETSMIGPLVDKLIQLNSSQRLALADALEQAWHRGMNRENKSPKVFFATLGIDLT
jgi:hypothetical protein